jgi:hypothetical protein
MDARNEHPPGDGAREGLLFTSPDCGAESITPRERELFGVAAEVDDRTTPCAPCPRCGTTIAPIGRGSGPHHASLRCLRGHRLGWLPRPRRAS